MAAVAVLCFSAAFAAVKWSGYADVSGMSRSAREALLNEASHATASASEDANGNVTYYDNKGNPTMALTAEESAQYERERQEAHDRAVIESAALVDASTIPLLPNSITEVAVDAQGGVPDFALGNGSMLVLHPEGEEGYALHRGDSVTLSLDASEACNLQFGLFEDGVYTETETRHEKELSYTFGIAEEGVYCFSITYCSAGADTFSNVRLTIN